MKKIAIVTPELVGIYKNGGIGTNYFFRARFLNSCLNYQVTILYTGECSPSAAQAWREQYGHNGIRLEVLPRLSTNTNSEIFHRRAEAVHQRFAAEAWDEIHFSEYLANGFVCLQAKRSGLAYQNTRLMVTMDSSSLWCREGMQQSSLDPGTDTKVDYAEQYCCENADLLVSPSCYLMHWAEGRGWRLPPNRVVLPNLCERLGDENPAAVRINPRHLIFFGRLETRKGLEIFCEAVELLSKAGKAPARVDFLGRVGTHQGQPADRYISQMSSRWQETETQIHSDLDNFAAMKHIRRTGGVAIIASPYDNLPYTVIECIVNQMPFIASDSGGIPELADSRVLFAPNARSLSAKIEEFSRLSADTRFNHPYKFETVRQTWKKFAEIPVETIVPSAGLPTLPKISVCVPFYNHGSYLPEALASLACQTYENFEVIVVDDGSTDASSMAQFDWMQKEYLPPLFRFFKQQNGGVGAARNFAAAQATGDLLLFMDADNVAREQMLTVFAKAMQVSGADCATCNYDVFEGAPNLQKLSVHTCAPLGPCLEAGWRENIFGDANLVVKKAVLAALGGFNNNRSAVEDWQFLVRLTIQGFRQIVVPESLYWYRLLPNSMMRTADEIRYAWTILETYREGLSSWPAKIIENHAFGSHLNSISLNTITINNRSTPTDRKAGQRKTLFRKLQRSCAKRLLELAGFIARL
jgi:glycosyltransferase involved in cell wall biosynthesis